MYQPHTDGGGLWFSASLLSRKQGVLCSGRLESSLRIDSLSLSLEGGGVGGTERGCRDVNDGMLKSTFFFLSNTHTACRLFLSLLLSLLCNHRLPVPHHYIHNAVIRIRLCLHVASVAMSMSSPCQTVFISEKCHIKKILHVVVVHSQVACLENSPTQKAAVCILHIFFFFKKMCKAVMAGC